MNTKIGKFLAKATVFGGSMDSKGNILSKDTHGLPAIWLAPIAGSIPNRNTLSGSVAQRAGIKMDSNGVIGRGDTSGNPFSFRLIFGQYTHVGYDDRYGDQYTFTILQDLTESSNVAKEILELEILLGEASIFAVNRPEMPEDYKKKTVQHISARRLDPNFHSTIAVDSSNVVEQALDKVGSMRSDSTRNPEVTVAEDVTEIIKKNKIAKS